MVTYDQALADHRYLWSIAPANDMTGGYVDQQDLKMLLNNPSKKTARDCLVRQINYWFDVGPCQESMGRGVTSLEVIQNDPIVAEIAKRYGIICDEQ